VELWRGLVERNSIPVMDSERAKEYDNSVRGLPTGKAAGSFYARSELLG